jgi:hypothetical protein
MESRWIKVRAVRPNKGMHLRIQPNVFKNAGGTEWSVHRSGKHWPKIDFSRKPVTKRDPQSIWANDLKICDTMQGVNHAGSYKSGSMGIGSAPDCNRSQSALNSD